MWPFDKRVALLFAMKVFVYLAQVWLLMSVSRSLVRCAEEKTTGTQFWELDHPMIPLRFPDNRRGSEFFLYFLVTLCMSLKRQDLD